MSAGKEHTIQTQRAQTDYTERNNTAIPFYHKVGQTATAGTFRRRIGSTVFRVNVHYYSTSKETMNDKITRLVKNDDNMGPPQNRRFCGERRSDGVSELSGLSGSERYEVRDDEKAAN